MDGYTRVGDIIIVGESVSGHLKLPTYIRTIDGHLLPHIQSFEEQQSQAHISAIEEAVTPVQL